MLVCSVSKYLTDRERIVTTNIIFTIKILVLLKSYNDKIARCYNNNIIYNIIDRYVIQACPSGVREAYKNMARQVVGVY